MRRAALVLLALAAGGCAIRAPRVELPPGTTAERLLAGLDARRAAVTSLRGRVNFRSGLANVWARQAVLVQRPNAVRIDVLSPFGLALALGTDGETLWVYPPQDRVRYEGAATPDNLARFFGAAVAIDDLVDVLMGLPPRRAPSGPVRLVPWPDGSARVVIPFAGGEQRLDFEGRPPEVRRVEEERERRLVLEIEFDDYRDGFPRTMDLRAPDDTTARVRYVEVEPNVALDARAFRAPWAPRVLPLDTIQVRR